MPVLVLLLALVSAAQAAPAVSTIPARPLIERARDSQRLNFDLVFASNSDAAVRLDRLQVTLFDNGGGFVAQQRLDTNGDSTTMSIATVPNRVLPAHGRLVVFNPFWRFPPDLRLGRMRYVATFDSGDTSAIEISPVPYEGKPMAFPLRGEVFVHDGHDLYGHHRRLDITGGMTTHFGIKENFMRYAHDFVITDRAGRMYKTDGASPGDWYGYGAQILAPAAGTVSEVRNHLADNVMGGPPPFREDALMSDLTLILGNYVVLAHEDGTYSVLAHMKQGSVRVKPGQRVREGEVIGGMGMSGDAFLVHLHYQHQSGARFEDGLPAYFKKMRVRNGSGWSKPYDGPVDSGDVVEAIR